MKYLLTLAVCVWLMLPAKAQLTLSHPDTAVNRRDTGESKPFIQAPPVASSQQYNMYGDLMNDDTAYNKKYKVWVPASGVLLANGMLLAIDRYAFNFPFSHVNSTTWKNNLTKGFEWDNDPFGVNFIGHPYTGNMYFNMARSNGYNYWQSFPFAVEGSLVWEYFGENTRPSYNDIINTPVSGAFLGEILYRLSSNMLDDRQTGGNRFFREFAAGLLNPSRALNRLVQGKMGRVTTREVYQKEPLNVTMWAGIHKVNVDRKFGTGKTNEILNLQFDYGNPFEVRHRKPFDFFKLKTELTFNKDRKLVENVTGYGILVGRNLKVRSHDMLLGLYQHYDYWDNNLFQLGSLGFGAGIVSRIPVRKHSNFYSSVHLAVVPLAGNSTRTSVDLDAKFREYSFGGGFEAKSDQTFNLNDWASLGYSAYYYWIRTYHGAPGFTQLTILKPRVTVRVFSNVSLGLEQHFYHNVRSLNGIPTFRVSTTEQKVFIQFFFEDKKRTGKFH